MDKVLPFVSETLVDYLAENFYKHPSNRTQKLLRLVAGPTRRKNRRLDPPEDRQEIFLPQLVSCVDAPPAATYNDTSFPRLLNTVQIPKLIQQIPYLHIFFSIAFVSSVAVKRCSFTIFTDIHFQCIRTPSLEHFKEWVILHKHFWNNITFILENSDRRNGEHFLPFLFLFCNS